MHLCAAMSWLFVCCASLIVFVCYVMKEEVIVFVCVSVFSSISMSSLIFKSATALCLHWAHMCPRYASDPPPHERPTAFCKYSTAKVRGKDADYGGTLGMFICISCLISLRQFLSDYSQKVPRSFLCADIYSQARTLKFGGVLTSVTGICTNCLLLTVIPQTLISPVDRV